MPRETENTIRVDVPGIKMSEHSGHKLRTISISASEGISALYCVDDKLVLVYIFNKDKGWTMATAKEWVIARTKAGVSKPVLPVADNPFVPVGYPKLRGFKCPKCGHTMVAIQGSRLSCPKCNSRMRVMECS